MISHGQDVKSPITNRWGEGKTYRIPVEHILVFRGYPGAAYSHHPQLASHQGKLYATWSNGMVGEDNPGQKMLLSVSEDLGDTWSRPLVIAAPSPGQYAYEVITSMGIRESGGRLFAYYGVYEYTDRVKLSGNPPERPKSGKISIPEDENWHMNTRMEIRVSDDGGTSWSAPRVILRGSVANLSPVKTSSGRLIMPGNISFAYTDDPAGISGWKRSGIPRLPEGYIDDPEGFHKVCEYRGDTTHYCEGDFYQTDDGTLHMMLRTSHYQLAVTESRDDGITWSEPRWTDYTDSRCRFDFGRLPDGKFYGLSTPQPGSGRTPMVMALSEDGIVFDRHIILGEEKNRQPRMPGGHKGGLYGYPYLHIMDEHAFVIYSVVKEDIGIARFALKDLDL
jgi:hypothetical protein